MLRNAEKETSRIWDIGEKPVNRVLRETWWTVVYRRLAAVNYFYHVVESGLPTFRNIVLTDEVTIYDINK